MVIPPASDIGANQVIRADLPGQRSATGEKPTRPNAISKRLVAHSCCENATRPTEWESDKRSRLHQGAGASRVAELGGA
jgi:hypothetical protein